MAMQLENPHAGEFILSEGAGKISRDDIVLASGQSLQAGAVLGQISASLKFKEYDPGALDGSQSPAGILFAETDAGSADKGAVSIARLAEVKASSLRWKNGVTDNQKLTALAALAASKFIIAR